VTCGGTCPPSSHREPTLSHPLKNNFLRVYFYVVMRGSAKERWQILCEQAANEQDTEKLIELVREINELLGAKEKRLDAASEEKDKGAGERT
jgi:hypothetical protein